MSEAIHLYRHLLRELKKHHPRPETYESIRREIRYHYYSFRTTEKDLTTGYNFLQWLREYRHKNSWPSIVTEEKHHSLIEQKSVQCNLLNILIYLKKRASEFGTGR